MDFDDLDKALKQTVAFLIFAFVFISIMLLLTVLNFF